MNGMRKCCLAIVLVVSIMIGGCGAVTADSVGVPSISNEVAPDKFAGKKPRLKLDNAGLVQTCTGPSDPTCQKEGANQLLRCSPKFECEYWETDALCTYPDGLDGGPKVCLYKACSTDFECETQNADPTHQTTSCIVTQASNDTSDIGGICFDAYMPCEVLPNTNCKASGVYVQDGNEWVCSAKADMTKATIELCNGLDDDCDDATDESYDVGMPCDGSDSDKCLTGTWSCTADHKDHECLNETIVDVVEVCDGADNDCDGVIDNGFNIGKSCDGLDSDMCKNGTWTCTSDHLDHECLNETAVDLVETCNGLDDDCDGAVDNGFPTLTDACDGADTDMCANGTIVCSEDGDGVVCNEKLADGAVEVCDGADNDCDGAIDEGCDDDSDGYCDSTMTFAVTAACKAGDCNDLNADINPAAIEWCDSIDNDCDGQTDEGYKLGESCTAGLGVCQGSGTYATCAAGGASSVCSAQADPTKKLDSEICDGKDNTCDGTSDEGCDDDADGFCDANMVTGDGATCDGAFGDCDDTNKDIHPGATELCDGVDNACLGHTDEGCDDDEDGYCDATMTFAAGAACKAGDCDDNNVAINPGMEESCLTPGDDNCDGDTIYKADGVTLACNSCDNAVKLTCNQEYVIDMAAEPNTGDAINTYTCWRPSGGAKTLGTSYLSPEVVLVPNVVAGTKFSFQIMTAGQNVMAFRLHGTCEPDPDTTSVSAYNEAAGLDGTCAEYSATAVANGVVGDDYIVLDAPTAKTVTVKFTCNAP